MELKAHTQSVKDCSRHCCHYAFLGVKHHYAVGICESLVGISPPQTSVHTPNAHPSEVFTSRPDKGTELRGNPIYMISCMHRIKIGYNQVRRMRSVSSGTNREHVPSGQSNRRHAAQTRACATQRAQSAVQHTVIDHALHAKCKTPSKRTNRLGHPSLEAVRVVDQLVGSSFHAPVVSFAAASGRQLLR